MTPQQYITSTLQALAEPVQMETIGNTPLQEAIFAKVMSKKFRKLKADDETIRITKNAISLAVSNNKPVTVSFLFGGNKLWRFDEAPEIDWAELFSLIYFVRWMKSIASVYGPGARLDYYSEDVAVETLNNVSRAETEVYSKTFRDMLDWFKPYIPKNVTITYRRYAEEYKDYSDYLHELEAAKVLVLKENSGKLPELSERQKTATELNVRLVPGQDEDPLWRERVELIHQSLEKTDTIDRCYFKDPTLILACPTYYSGWIATGSTKKSYAKFWAGLGVLEKSGDSFNELVLTPKQLDTAKFDWQSINVEGLPGKNFSKVRVLK
jgi:hypothetical protein